MSENKQGADSRLNILAGGIIHGLTVRDPQSATLTGTVLGGEVRIASSTPGVGFVAYVLSQTTKAFTVSKDTYYYISGTDGTRGYYEASNGGAKPVIGTDIPANSQFLAKVVTDGTRITSGGVTDLRAESGAVLESTFMGGYSFVTAGQGAQYWTAPCDGEIKHIYGSVTGALGGTDTGTITAAIGLNDVYVNVTNGVATFALSAAVGDRATTEAFPSALRTFRRGQTVRLTSAKTTTNGTVNIWMTWDKQA